MAVGSVVRTATAAAGVALLLFPVAAHAQQSGRGPDSTRVVPGRASRPAREVDSAEVARQLRELERVRVRFTERMRGLQAKLQAELAVQARLMNGIERDLQRATALAPSGRDSILRAAEPRLNESARKLAAVQREIETVLTTQLDREVQSVYPGLRDVSSPAEARVIGDMVGDVTRMAMEAAMAARALAAQQASLARRATAEPSRGRIGVTLSGGQYTWVRDGTAWTRYVGPQVVEAVEPGGPADKAGIEAGDTLLAIGRYRVDDGDVPLGALLVPGETLALRVRRRGQETTRTLVVGERVSNVPYAAVAPCPPGAACTPRFLTGATSNLPQPPRTPPSPATATTAGQTSWSYTFDNSLAGAVLATIDTDLEELLGTDDGALVLRVAPGSPAAEAGLRGGDVIVSVDDASIDSPREVQQAMRKAQVRGARALSLVVVRKGASRKVELKW